MFDKFIFNKRNSFDDMGLAVLKGVEDPITEEEVENIPVERRKNGSLTRRTGNYKDLIVTRTVKLLDMEDYEVKKRKLNKWFDEIVDNRLVFENQPNKAYIVKNVKIGSLKRTEYHYSSFDITFVCEPFIKDRNNNFIDVVNGSKILNNGDFESEPDITFTSTTIQNIQISINGRTFQVNAVSGEVKISSSLLQVTGASVIRTIGDFPSLDIGENTIIYTGNITNFKLKPNKLYRS